MLVDQSPDFLGVAHVLGISVRDPADEEAEHIGMNRAQAGHGLYQDQLPFPPANHPGVTDHQGISRNAECGTDRGGVACRRAGELFGIDAVVDRPAAFRRHALANQVVPGGIGDADDGAIESIRRVIWRGIGPMPRWWAMVGMPSRRLAVSSSDDVATPLFM